MKFPVYTLVQSSDDTFAWFARGPEGLPDMQLLGWSPAEWVELLTAATRWLEERGIVAQVHAEIRGVSIVVEAAS